jgi:hypothetical protein
MDQETNIKEIAFLEVTLYEDGKCFIEIADNGQLSKNIAMAMVKDDNLLGILAEAYIIYQDKMGITQHSKTKN